jgi:hypothetical protein
MSVWSNAESGIIQCIRALYPVLQRIQLLQDFEMPTASTRIKMTPDQQHIMATGKFSNVS